MKARLLALASMAFFLDLAPAAAAPRCDADGLPLPAGALGEPACKPAKAQRPTPREVERGREKGRIDLGGGTELRIGGRVRTETDVRR